MKSLPGHVSAGIAGEKGHGFGDVLRFSSMAEGNSFGRGFPLGVGVSRPDPLGRDSSGSYDIGAHAEGASSRASVFENPTMPALAAA